MGAQTIYSGEANKNVQMYNLILYIHPERLIQFFFYNVLFIFLFKGECPCPDPIGECPKDVPEFGVSCSNMTTMKYHRAVGPSTSKS